MNSFPLRQHIRRFGRSIYFRLPPRWRDSLVQHYCRYAAPLHACDQPALLHVGHSWGGGIDRWIHDYAAADRDNWNLLLRSRTRYDAAGVELELVDLAAQDEVLLGWELDDPIACTATRHGQYRQILAEITAGFGVEAVIVSSLIGHSLDVLDGGLPTGLVLHDFVPFCPALFAWYGQPCVSCDRTALERCLAGNPQNAFWHLDDADQWLALRAAYAERLASRPVRIAAPGRAVHARYATLFPVLRERPWREIPHGLGHVPQRAQPPETRGPLGHRRLRVVVPGRLQPHKGLHLFLALLGELTDFADVLLLGSGDYGLPFRGQAGVEVVPDYANAALADQVRDFAPDCALLLSILPESFSYTLSEMFALGVPVVATRLGAFAERIEDGCNGFLVDPEPAAVVRRLRALSQTPDVLDRVAKVLRAQAVRSAEAMVKDYRDMLGLDPAPVGQRPRPGALARAAVREAAVRRYRRAQIARRPPAAESAGADPVRPIGIAVAPGDLMALARARRIGQGPGDPSLAGDAGPVPAGFSLLFCGAGADRDRHSVACFEGLGHAPDTGSTALAMQLDRVVTPTAGIAQRFRSLWPDAPARVTVIPFPLVAQWPSATDPGALRQRDKLGLPDRARLVLGIGPVGPDGGLERFAGLATRTCERRNDVRFVWLGGRDPDWERAHWLAVGLPVAMRQLFLVDDENLAAWLGAADAYIGCRPAAVYDPGALEALGAGLPVCVASRASLPEAVWGPPCAGLLAEGVDTAAIDWLEARLAERDGLHGGDDACRGRVLARFAGPPAREAFRAACRASG